MKAGQLRQMIVFQTLGTTGDGGGGVASESWTDFAPAMYAHIEPLAGRDLVQAQQINSELTHRIEMQYYPGITSQMRG